MGFRSRAREGSFHHRIRGDKKGMTFIPIEKPVVQSRRYCDYASACEGLRVVVRMYAQVSATLVSIPRNLSALFAASHGQHYA